MSKYMYIAGLFLMYIDLLCYLYFFIQLDGVLNSAIVETKVEIYTGTSIIGLCYPTVNKNLVIKRKIIRRQFKDVFHLRNQDLVSKQKFQSEI